MDPKAVKIMVFPERSAVREDAPSDLDVVVEVRCETAAEDNAAKREKKMNLALVIDRSGSMGGDKLETAKRSCIDILKRLGEDDLLTVAVFDDEAEVVINPQTPRSEAEAKLRAIQTRGMTNLSLGWYLGLLELQTHATDNHYNRLILLSDGIANAGETKRATLAREAAQSRELGITSSTIGIGEDFAEDLLDAIASSSGGRFWNSSESRLDEIIEEEFRGALSVILDRPRVELSLPDGVRVSQELNSLTKTGNRYRLRPLKGKDVTNFAVRLSVDPQLVPAAGFDIQASLFDGERTVCKGAESVGKRPVQQTATMPLNALTLSVVKQYEMATAGEAMMETLDSGEMNLMKKLLVEEVAGMRKVRDALTAERYDAEDALRYQGEMANISHHLLMSEQSLELLEMLRPYMGVDPECQRFVSASWRKGMRGEQHRMSSRRNDVVWSDEMNSEDLLVNAIALGNSLAARYPADAPRILTHVEKLREFLENA